jgi:succinate dehydrogenase/fumarate reductase cytochrome b subunit
VLLAFVVEHACANALLVLPDATWFDAYVASMARWWAIRVAEVLLAATFCAHVAGGWTLRRRTKANLAKRSAPLPKPPMTLRLVGTTGTALLLFLAMHLSMFVAPRLVSGATPPGYGAARAALASLPIVLMHCVAMAALILHLRYGIAAAITVFPGLPKAWIPRVKRLALQVAILAPTALAIISVAVYLGELWVAP